jgi:hypothetical protein
MGAQKTADYIKPTRGSALFCLYKPGSFKRLLIGDGADSPARHFLLSVKLASSFA